MRLEYVLWLTQTAPNLDSWFNPYQSVNRLFPDWVESPSGLSITFAHMPLSSLHQRECVGVGVCVWHFSMAEIHRGGGGVRVVYFQNLLLLSFLLSNRTPSLYNVVFNNSYPCSFLRLLRWVMPFLCLLGVSFQKTLKSLTVLYKTAKEKPCQLVVTTKVRWLVC